MRVVVDILTGRACRIVERYHPNFHPFYADFRVHYADGVYKIVRQRHMREAMTGEVRTFNQQWRSAGRAALSDEVTR